MSISLTTQTDLRTSQELEQPTSEGRSWLLFAGVVVFLVLAAATKWILSHPYGIHWDEAFYFDEALSDIHKLHSGSLRQLVSVFIGGDPFRPPAYRLVPLPFFLLFGFHTAMARFITLALWLGTVGFIFLTSRRIANPVAGAVAALVFCLAPEVLSASTFYSTEGPLLLATSAMMYFLLDYWSDEGCKGWVGLGLALGLGVLSKITFVLIAGPILAVTLIRHRPKPFSAEGWKPLLKSGSLALVVAAPWWLKNIGAAVRYSGWIRLEPRESFGAPSLLTWAKWLGSIVMGLLGPAVAILIFVVAVVSVRKILSKKEIVLNPIHRTAVLACVWAGLPLVVLQLSGMNHNLRYMTPILIPLAIAIGVLSEATGWIHSRGAVVITSTLIVAQLLMIVTPVAFPKPYAVDPGLVNGGLPWGIWVRFEQWDWKPIRGIASSCGLQQPKIAFLGIGRALNPPQIAYPWFVDGTASSDAWWWRSQPLWLWRSDRGPFDWQKVMSASEESEIVLTAPGFIGQVSDKQDIDNRYNREFEERLAADPLFRGPIRLKMGQFDEPVEVTVFVKATLACHFSGEALPKASIEPSAGTSTMSPRPRALPSVVRKSYGLDVP